MFFNQYNMEQQEEIAEKIIKQAYDDGGEVCLCDTGHCPKFCVNGNRIQQ